MRWLSPVDISFPQMWAIKKYGRPHVDDREFKSQLAQRVHYFVAQRQVVKRDEMLCLFSAVNYLLKIFFEQRIKFGFKLRFADLKRIDQPVPFHLNQEYLLGLGTDRVQLFYIEKVSQEDEAVLLVLLFVDHDVNYNRNRPIV
jgi:hypothetical protein